MERTGGGGALALDALLDGVPEQMVRGIGLASGEGLPVAIFVSNLPEAIGGSAGLRAAGHPASWIRRLWIVVVVAGTVAAAVGYAAADATDGDFRAVINGFAAGALLVMLIDSMIPESTGQAAARQASSRCSASPWPQR